MHWPALLKINQDRPQRLERKARRKRRSASLSTAQSSAAARVDTASPTDRPFSENPYDMYHPNNANSIRCCTTKAFRYWVKPHLTPKTIEEDRTLVPRRVKLILDQLVFGRDLFSKTIPEDGSTVQVAQDIPNANIVTQEPKLSTDELKAYRDCEARCGKFLLGGLSSKAIEAMKKNGGLKSNGSKFVKVSVLSTHIGLAGLQNDTTDQMRKRRAEGLPLLVARMKQIHAFDPNDLDKPIKHMHECTEIHEHHMITKANSLFAAFKTLKDARDEAGVIDDGTSCGGMAMGAFSICRRRVKLAVDIASANSKQRIARRKELQATNVMVDWRNR
ncbi:hypothetical protein OPT61_g9149 [Boeremia exigua]|uniref:Uncharacterized protein n=1 Tax=Boeremia exigua TaxID=749465 RepID=A0ACC2HW80_9PLEO|nr:hypothetical protein OPT61_g9149 [Boeremia exigua]